MHAWQALADQHGIKFYETSAKNNINVEEAFCRPHAVASPMPAPALRSSSPTHSPRPSATHHSAIRVHGRSLHRPPRAKAAPAPPRAPLMQAQSHATSSSDCSTAAAAARGVQAQSRLARVVARPKSRRAASRSRLSAAAATRGHLGRGRCDHGCRGVWRWSCRVTPRESGGGRRA